MGSPLGGVGAEELGAGEPDGGDAVVLGAIGARCSCSGGGERLMVSTKLWERRRGSCKREGGWEVKGEGQVTFFCSRDWAAAECGAAPVSGEEGGG